MIKRIVYILVAVAVLASCTKKDDNVYMNESGFFTSKTNLGAYSKTGDLVSFNESAHQLAASEEENSFRIQDDAQTVYVSCTLANDPTTLSVGEESAMTIIAVGVKGLHSSVINVTLVKSEGDKYWFMNSTQDLGIVFSCK